MIRRVAPTCHAVSDDELIHVMCNGDNRAGSTVAKRAVCLQLRHHFLVDIPDPLLLDLVEHDLNLIRVRPHLRKNTLFPLLHGRAFSAGTNEGEFVPHDNSAISESRRRDFLDMHGTLFHFL